MRRFLALFVPLLFNVVFAFSQVADKESYLSDVVTELGKSFPDNKTLNLVFHGHSVPSGYFDTPEVNTLQAYPQQVLNGLKHNYHYAVINVITTAIGGTNAINGAARFEKDVLTHKPDVVFIDYALNDRGNDLRIIEKSWRSMIEAALDLNIKVILITPTIDPRLDIKSDSTYLFPYVEMIRSLAAEYHIGLADPYECFYQKAKVGEDLSSYLCVNIPTHPNAEGHKVVAAEILHWFDVPTLQ